MLKMSAWAALLIACNRSGAPGADWSSVALDETVESRVKNANFEIQLPKGWKRDVNDELMKGWRPNVEDYTGEPSVTVGYVQQPPQSLDSYIKSLTFEGTPIVDKKIMNADYLVVVSHTVDNGIVKVDYMSHKGDTYLGCSAFQMRRGGVPNPKTTMEWLEKLCKSLTIK
jgi:hypothetical protein